MVVGVRHVVVGTLGVAAVVKGGIWLLGSTLVAASEENGKRWKKGRKAAVSTHPKYSQARTYTTYASVSMEWVVSVDWTAECQKRRGKPSLSKTSIFKQLQASCSI